MADQMTATATMPVGTELASPTRRFTLARRRWYSSGLRTAATGTLSSPMLGGIHDDDEYARGQGLKAPIIDGMSITNWCSALLLQHFGLDYVARGDLRTKFIKPTYMGDTVTVRAKVTGVGPEPGGGVRTTLDVWCENQDGVRITDGDAFVVQGAP